MITVCLVLGSVCWMYLVLRECQCESEEDPNDEKMIAGEDGPHARKMEQLSTWIDLERMATTLAIEELGPSYLGLPRLVTADTFARDSYPRMSPTFGTAPLSSGTTSLVSSDEGYAD